MARACPQLFDDFRQVTERLADQIASWREFRRSFLLMHKDGLCMDAAIMHTIENRIRDEADALRKEIWASRGDAG